LIGGFVIYRRRQGERRSRREKPEPKRDEES
jgi:hypothetical protein